MATTTSIIVLLKFFATRQKNAVVDYRDFCEYLKKYSEHHLEEQPTLSVYLEDPVPALQTELDKLVESRQIVMTQLHGDKSGILVIPYYIERFAERYKDIAVNPSLPFPARLICREELQRKLSPAKMPQKLSQSFCSIRK